MCIRDRQYAARSFSSSTRGLWYGGYPGGTSVNTIEFVTISSTGDAVDFGDLTQQYENADSAGSPTSLIMNGKAPDNPYHTAASDYITIATTGNAARFGNLTSTHSQAGAGSNAVRCVFGGGYTGPIVNVIDYFTISTLGDGIDFGDLTTARQSPGAAASSTRCLFASGENSPAGNQTIVDYIQIMTTGNAVDFGDGLPAAGLEGPVGFSNGHGGLG